MQRLRSLPLSLTLGTYLELWDVGNAAVIAARFASYVAIKQMYACHPHLSGHIQVDDQGLDDAELILARQQICQFHVGIAGCDC